MSDRSSQVKRVRHWSDTAQDLPPAKKQRRKQAKNRLRKMALLTLSLTKLRRFAFDGGDPLPIVLSFNTARTLREQLVEELDDLFWTDAPSMLPWENYFCIEQRPIEHLIRLREGTTQDVRVSIDDPAALKQEMDVCYQQLFGSPS